MTWLPPASRKFQAGAAIVGLALLVCVLSLFGIWMTAATGRVAGVWLSNAVVLSVLLQATPRQWPAWLGAGLAGNVAANLIVRDPLLSAALLGSCNTLEVLAAAWLMYRRGARPRFDITHVPTLTTFLWAATVVAPAASSLSAAAILHAIKGAPFGGTAIGWFLADSLGMLIVVPVWSAAMRQRASGMCAWPPRRISWLLIVAIPFVSAAVFSRGRDEWLFLVVPLVVLPAFELGFEGTGMAIVAAGLGGLAGIALQPGGLRLADRDQFLALQVFLVANSLTALPFAALVQATRDSGRQAHLAAKALTREKTRFDDLVNHIPMGIYRMYTNDRGETAFSYVSPQMSRLVGISVDDLLADAMLAFRCAHPDDAEALVRAHTTAAANLSSFRFEGRFVVAGRLRWLRIESEPESLAGGSEWSGVVADVTDRVEQARALAEAELALERLNHDEWERAERVRAEFVSLLQATLESSADGILVVSNEGAVTWFNSRFLEMWRVPDTVAAARDDDVMLSYVSSEVVDRDAFVAQVHALYAKPEVESVDMIECVDGRVFERYSRPQRLHNAFVGRVWSFRDVTARTRAERELRTVLEQLEQRVDEGVTRAIASERALIHQSRLAAMGEMVGNIAHQWRQPLNTLAIVLGNLRDTWKAGELTDEGLSDAVAQGQRLIRQMSNTISDFTEFFRPDKEARPFAVRRQIEESVSLVAASFRHHGITVSVEGGENLLSAGFPNEYAQVVVNLLSNARDAILNAGVTTGYIHIAIVSDGEWCRVTVSDNGGGISLDPIERVFEPYVTTKSGGTGLGLYMSKVIIEQSMAGRISACNTGEGAAFTVSTPLAGGPYVDPQE